MANYKSSRVHGSFEAKTIVEAALLTVNKIAVEMGGTGTLISCQHEPDESATAGVCEIARKKTVHMLGSTEEIDEVARIRFTTHKL